MKGRIWTVSVGLAALAALVAVPAAMAAYTSPKLEVTQTATGVVVKASLDPNDDPTAAVVIVRTERNTVDDDPGAWCGSRAGPRDREGTRPRRRRSSARGPARRRCSRPGAGGDPDGVHRGRAAACHLGHGAHGGRTDAVRSHVPRLHGRHAAGPARPSSGSASLRPTCPSGPPGERRSERRSTAPSSPSTASSVVWPTGAWISSWVPYRPAAGTPNPAAVVVAPAAIAPGAVSIAAKISGRGAIAQRHRHARRPARVPEPPSRSSVVRRSRGSSDAQARQGRGERKVHDRNARSGRSSALTRPQRAERRRPCARRYSR